MHGQHCQPLAFDVIVADPNNKQRDGFYTYQVPWTLNKEIIFLMDSFF